VFAVLAAGEDVPLGIVQTQELVGIRTATYAIHSDEESRDLLSDQTN